MKGLITIYVSVFLAFSPLLGQSKQDARLIQQRKSEWMDYWNIRLIGGEVFPHVALLGLKGDSLVIGDLESTKTIYIGSIANISAAKNKTKAGKYSNKGFIIGALIPITFLVIPCIADYEECNSQDFLRGGDLIIFGFLAAGVMGVVSAGFGAVIGRGIKYVEEYDMTSWSIDEKRAQIQKIMKRETRQKRRVRRRR